MSPSSLNLNIKSVCDLSSALYMNDRASRFVDFFSYTVAMNMMYALLSDTVSRLPVSTLNIGNMSHKQDLSRIFRFCVYIWNKYG